MKYKYLIIDEDGLGIGVFQTSGKYKPLESVTNHILLSGFTREVIEKIIISPFYYKVENGKVVELSDEEKRIREEELARILPEVDKENRPIRELYLRVDVLEAKVTDLIARVTELEKDKKPK